MDTNRTHLAGDLQQNQNVTPPQKKKKRKPFWLRHLILALCSFGVWTGLGLPFGLGTEPIDMAIDGAGWLICCLYLAIALVAGLITGLAALVRRMLTSLHSPNFMS
jgi:uncharacterized membrane protein YhaH (DUF805 family)